MGASWPTRNEEPCDPTFAPYALVLLLAALAPSVAAFGFLAIAVIGILHA